MKDKYPAYTYADCLALAAKRRRRRAVIGNIVFFSIVAACGLILHFTW